MPAIAFLVSQYNGVTKCMVALRPSRSARAFSAMKIVTTSVLKRVAACFVQGAVSMHWVATACSREHSITTECCRKRSHSLYILRTDSTWYVLWLTTHTGNITRIRTFSSRWVLRSKKLNFCRKKGLVKTLSYLQEDAYTIPKTTCYLFFNRYRCEPSARIHSKFGEATAARTEIARSQFGNKKNVRRDLEGEEKAIRRR